MTAMTREQFEQEFNRKLQAINNPSGTGTWMVNEHQAMELLEKLGRLTGKPQAGVMDDIRKAFRLFTQTNYQGIIQPGIMGPDGSTPPPLSKLFETTDLIGTAWNYGFGPIISLFEGYRLAGSGNAKGLGDIYKNTMRELGETATVKRKEALEYLGKWFDKRSGGSASNTYDKALVDGIRNLHKRAVKSEYMLGYFNPGEHDQIENYNKLIGEMDAAEYGAKAAVDGTPMTQGLINYSIIKQLVEV